MACRRWLSFLACVLGIASLALACRAPAPAPAPASAPPFFQRYTPPDPEGFAREIEEVRAEVAALRARGDRAAALRATAELGGMLTSARREREAEALLVPALAEARAHAALEATGWVLLYLATTHQYLGRPAVADAQFREALAIAERVPSEELAHFTLHHHGRLLVERGDLAAARVAFERALAIRVRLGVRWQASTRRALAALAALERDAR